MRLREAASSTADFAMTGKERILFWSLMLRVE
jgi:hypothetical protein